MLSASLAMSLRRRFQQKQSLEHRLSEEAEKLRKEARGTPPGIERDRLIRRARQAETAAHMNGWLLSPELQPPK
jgi:predicted trehalose synthase